MTGRKGSCRPQVADGVGSGDDQWDKHGGEHERHECDEGEIGHGFARISPLDKRVGWIGMNLCGRDNSDERSRTNKDRLRCRRGS